MTRERFGSVAIIVLALYLLIVGAALVISIAIPPWAIGGLAIVAGILLLVGR